LNGLPGVCLLLLAGGLDAPLVALQLDEETENRDHQRQQRHAEDDRVRTRLAEGLEGGNELVGLLFLLLKFRKFRFGCRLFFRFGLFFCDGLLTR
jgi:hypothetical protein